MENKSRALSFQADTTKEVSSTETFKQKIQKLIRKNIYRWHRILGIMAIVPTIFWTASGIMHPFMSHWFKVNIANEFYKAETVENQSLKLSLPQVLDQNNVLSFKNFRLVRFDKNNYYQIKDTKNILHYYHTETAKELINGDKKFAENMARFMLNDYKSKIQSITYITEFTDQYKFVNRFLPVWKVSFDRDDKMDIYVETGQSRFVTFNDSGRKAFIWIFSTFHDWGFMDMIANNTVRIFGMLFFLGIITFSAVAGLIIYGLMWKKFKPAKLGNSRSILRKYHRSIGLWSSIVTFTFAFSGAYHAVQKFDPDERLKFVYEPIIRTESIAKASMIDLTGISNISFAKWGENIFWQIVKKDPETRQTKIDYINVKDGKMLEDGNFKYARFLANRFSSMENSTSEACCAEMESSANSTLADAEILETKLVTKFAGEYGFVNKRLPVVKLSYDTPDHVAYYIETTTGRLSTKVNDGARREGFSFAFLHKFSYLDFLGKNMRDGIMTAAAMSVLLVSVLGLLVFLKVK